MGESHEAHPKLGMKDWTILPENSRMEIRKTVIEEGDSISKAQRDRTNSELEN